LVRTSLLFHWHSLTPLLSTVIHGYVQSGATLAFNSFPLKARLVDIANLHYVDGPPMYRNAPHSASRPWWILDNDLEHNVNASDRWNESVRSFQQLRYSNRITMLTK
jgi:hypothetical protein